VLRLQHSAKTFASVIPPGWTTSMCWVVRRLQVEATMELREQLYRLDRVLHAHLRDQGPGHSRSRAWEEMKLESDGFVFARGSSYVPRTKTKAKFYLQKKQLATANAAAAEYDKKVG